MASGSRFPTGTKSCRATVPLSALSGVSAGMARRLLGMREEYREPAITRAARRYRDELRALVEGKGTMTPAE